jgi:hypothetical protein
MSLRVRKAAPPSAQIVSLDEANSYLKISGDDANVELAIAAANEYAEKATGRSIAKTTYEIAADAFPYFTDTITSQQAYPPSYYSLPRYSTTLWNYSQMIKLSWISPVLSVEKIVYIGTDGLPHELLPGRDFIVDLHSEPARIFTMPGQLWPACVYTPNAVKIYVTAGYDADPDAVLEISASNPSLTDGEIFPDPPNQQTEYSLAIGAPALLKVAILQLVSHFYYNREPVAQGNVVEVPYSVQSMLSSYEVMDLAPTRG